MRQRIVKVITRKQERHEKRTRVSARERNSEKRPQESESEGSAEKLRRRNTHKFTYQRRGD